MSKIELKDISFSYDKKNVLSNINLDINDGEFFSLIGPSGAGKSTILNILSGFLTPNNGQILMDGKDITKLPPYKRQIGLVFQDYALFPHLNVYDNVAYGLKIQKKSKDDIDKLVNKYLSLVQLENYSNRMPHELSGGQQQRVAIARALVIEPNILLLDEPLSNLDAKLREEMRDVIHRLQRRINITTILVTHDQGEALSLSDNIAILGDSEIQQLGSPHYIYNHPNNAYVAKFIGNTNLIQCTNYSNVIETNIIDFNDKKLTFSGESTSSSKENTFMVRPERVILSHEISTKSLLGKINTIVYLGNAIKGTITFKEGQLDFYHTLNSNSNDYKLNDDVYVDIDDSDLVKIGEG